MGKYVLLWAHAVEVRFHAYCATNQCTHISARAKCVTIMLHYRLIPHCREYVWQLNGQITFHLSPTHNLPTFWLKLNGPHIETNIVRSSELLGVRAMHGVGAGWYNVWHCTYSLYGCFLARLQRCGNMGAEAMASHSI